MKTTLHYSLLCVCGFTFLSIHSQAQYYLETMVSDLNITYTLNGLLPEIYYGPKKLTSSGLNLPAVNISQDAFVEFKAGEEITLTDGFQAGPFNATSPGPLDAAGEFHTKLEDPMDILVIDPVNPVYTNGLLEIQKWEKFELAIKLPAEYETAISSFFPHYYANQVNPLTDLNPYASDSLIITFDFISPLGNVITKFGFFMREAGWGPPVGTVAGSELPVEVTTGNLADHHIHVRFAPTEESIGNLNWKVVMHIKAPFHAQLQEYKYTIFTLLCTPNDPDNHGFLKVNPTTKHHLQFETGEAFFGIGENFANARHPGWHSDGAIEAQMLNADNAYWAHFYKLEYDNLLQSINELSGAGGNYIRLFPTYALIEQENLGVYDYYEPQQLCNQCCGTVPGNRQNWLKMMDHIFETCHTHKIYMQYVLGDFPPQIAYETWSYGHNAYYNKYVVANNPNNQPLPISRYFLSDPVMPPDPNNSESFYYWKRKYKYFMSRYGYSVNLAVVEPFNEIDQTIGFSENDLTTTHLENGNQVSDYPTLCPDHLAYYPQSNDLTSTIGSWYSHIIDYIKTPVISGGLGESNKLFAVSFAATDFATPNYYDLWTLPQIDIVDLHAYAFSDDPTYNHRLATLGNFARNYLQNHTPPIIDKPVIYGESGNFGDIPIAGSGNVSTNDYYNNYDISLHNEIWSSAFSGNMAIGLSWFYQIIHKWPMGNPEPKSPVGLTNPFPNSQLANELNDPFDLYSPPVGTFQPNIFLPGQQIKTSYNNYKPLKDFLNNNIDYNQVLIPQSIYNDPEAPGVEIYYLTEKNGPNAYGWIHNINHYWANEYYYNNIQDQFSWSSCNLPLFTNIGVTIIGLAPNTIYDLSFDASYDYTPPLLTSVPASIQFTSNSSGEAKDANGHNIFDNTVFSWLGCDYTNADFSFTILPAPLRGLSQNGDSVTLSIKDQMEAFIYPNPCTGLFNIKLDAKNVNKSNLLRIIEISGKEVFSKYLNNQFVNYVNASFLAKGFYLVEIKNEDVSQILKLVIQ